MFTYKSFDAKRDKLFLSVAVAALALYMAFSCSYFTAAAGAVRESVVRLHIIANSNSQPDQDVKIKVRDALLEENNDILSKKIKIESAQEYFYSSREELLETVRKTLEENGFSYDASITLENEYYETRKYGDLTFPAGEYLSLKVILGEGSGENWWCVMFPPLCIPVADEVTADEEKSELYFSRPQEQLITGGKKYIVKFKLLELFEELKNNIR